MKSVLACYYEFQDRRARYQGCMFRLSLKKSCRILILESAFGSLMNDFVEDIILKA
jgi:hypothetical protein